MLEIHRAKIVRWAFIQIKVFNILLLLVKNVLRVRIPPPKACPVLAGATIVPRANIQWKKATRNRQNAKPVLSDSFKICPATPRAVNAPAGGETP
jgi:hypothetical protein